MIERMGFGTAKVRPGTDRVDLWPGETLTVGLGVTASSPDELVGAAAFVWTNYGSEDPRRFRALPMAEVAPSDAHQRAFEATLPVAALGTYIVTAYVVIDGIQHWAQQYADSSPSADSFNLQNRLVFRVSALEIEGLHVREVPIDKTNARADSTDISTIDDMLEDGPGWYSLRKLKEDGVNCVWVQGAYRLDLWDGLPSVDDAGSDYASTDWYSIDPELSLEAREVPPWDLDRQRRLANDAMKRFVDKAHQLGMKVIMEIAPNHVGHNFIFRDSFEEAGGLQVRRRDYSQVAVDATQLAQVNERLNSDALDERLKDYAEWMLPQMYATRYPGGRYNPFGAASVYETYSPDWYGTWADTKHLNHGGHAGQRLWVPSTEQNFRVLAYIGRAMRWAVTELGIDGFRIDHALGMPFYFFEQTLPWVEMKAREQRGEDSYVILVLEDHDRKAYTARVGDIVQSKGYEGLLHALARQDTERVWELYGNSDFTEEFVGTGNHDEVRGAEFFAGDLNAYGNAVITMQLMGGPMTMLAGDEYAEGQKLRFKAKGGIPTLWQLRQGNLPAANTNLAYWIGRGGQLKSAHPSLRGSNRERLNLRSGSSASRLLACGRSSEDPAEVPLLLFSNLERQAWTSATFEIGRRGRVWLQQAPNAFYQIRDLLGVDPERPLWRRPLLGQELIDEGIGVGLQPYQIQVLELELVS
jgi:hypothetical protein